MWKMKIKILVVNHVVQIWRHLSNKVDWCLPTEKCSMKRAQELNPV